MTAAPLAARKCAPCTGQTPTLPREAVRDMLPLVPCWLLGADGRRLVRRWRVKDFQTGLDFFRRIADVAEAEDHHPDLHLANYRDVTVEITTHAAGGLTENDFILAAKIDALPQQEPKG